MSVLTPTKIAEDFIKTMNPTNWDGAGDKPDDFNILIKTYDTKNPDMQLDVSFDYDTEDEEWCHYCELRDKESGDLIVPVHGYGVDSIFNLRDTIEDIVSHI